MVDRMNDRLKRLLGSPETAWLVERARRRLEQGRPLTGTVTLGAASPNERRAIERLLGRRAGTGTSLSVSLDEVDRVLRSSGACHDGLAAAVVVLHGPVRDLPRENAEWEAAWRDACAKLDAVVAARPELHGWRSWLDSTGQVRRSAPGPGEARVLLDQLAEVLRRLPSPGIPIGRLAAESCGDAHALDEGRPLATQAMSAARALGGLPYAGEGTADARRKAWAAVGVHLDDLSSTVVCLGLPGDDRTPTGRMLAAAREAGEPCVLTLRQLCRHETPIAAGLVRICENPVVVAAAADALGPLCPGLVCVSGRPSAAVWRLLDLLAAGGTGFVYHGDFDWGGIGIAAAVHERVGWRPWRYDAASYEVTPSRAPLTGRPRPTPWDPALSAAMLRRAVRIEEELVLGDLLADLAADL
ncbi:TIGR02679 family protein [Streptosporangium subroseum]|uniref:TIGR02679 family protein n=1 Tax=Streptosporangium subroseum TaxID=106412 RepID=A0A239AEW1_9ACTN|nr:TIGR02679 family protein [Streptosporangium subroseum]SNR93901.1 TIGR02679 family protein [Streptosporangium subroseum]